MKLVESQLGVEINYRGETVQIVSEDELTRERARKALQALQVLVGRGVPVHASDVIIAIKMVLNDDIENFTALYEVELTKDAAGKSIRLKNLIQKLMLILSNIMILFLELDQLEQGKRF